MKRVLLGMVLSLLWLGAMAQERSVVSGKVVDASSQRTLDFADVVITDAKNQNITSTQVRDGVFTLSTSREGEYTISIILVGYQPYATSVNLRRGETLDLGVISLAMVETGLEEVEVSAERNKVVYKLDRQRISGSASLSASGGTAVDILKNVPSVRIDLDGNLSFRGSTGFLVYVDGKQSMLEGTQALHQVAASNIEDIEIITTPSARYRSEGDVGIINIITKEPQGQGFNGSVNLSGSTIGTWNSDVLLGYTKGSSRWYAGMAGSEIKGKSDFDQRKTTVVDDFVTTSQANGKRYGNNSSAIGRLGWELDKSDHYFQVELQGGMTRWLNGGDMLYDEHRQQGDVVINDNLYDAHDHNYIEKQISQISTDYVWSINERGDELSIDGRLRYDWYSLEYTESNLFDMQGARYEGTRGYEREHHWDFDGSVNYLLHFGEKGRAEMGYQYTSYSEHGDYNIKYWDRQKLDYEWQDDLYAPFFYRRQIHAAYLMLSQEFGRFKADAGLRMEHMADLLTIEFEGADRDVKRTELYPSLHLSYDAPGDNTFVVGYSYRTNRAGVWKLEPYITYKDYYTKLTGNPDLVPEYIHSAEVGYRKRFGKENSLSLTGYFRHRRNTLDLIRVAYEPGVTLDSLINAGYDRTYGVELNSQVKNNRWWSMNINASLYHYDFAATFKGSTDATNTGYTASWINNFSLTPTTSMQFDANLVGPVQLSQGRDEAYCYFDLALRQQLFKRRMTASFVAQDIFRTARYDNLRDSPTLRAETYVKPRYPNFMLSLSYAFNLRGGKGQGAKSEGAALSSGATFTGKDF